MSDMKDWPMVPVDPACIPEGYEAVRVGWVNANEFFVNNTGMAVSWPCEVHFDLIPQLIVRPIPKPIKLPVQIVPPGWWVGKDDNGAVYIYEHNPKQTYKGFVCVIGSTHKLAKPIAAQLPEAYLALPWDQSLMQQTEGM